VTCQGLLWTQPLVRLGAQHRFDVAEKERELAILLREFAEARLELARRDTAGSVRPRPEPEPTLNTKISESRVLRRNVKLNDVRPEEP
jgi:hypothetical protein